MGICSSCESTHVATAKVILIDGRLQEYPYAVKVSYVLQRNNYQSNSSPGAFICNSDEMEFNDVVSPLNDDEDLQLGQLYFALPLNRLNKPLLAEEVAALAVKASSVLVKSHQKCGCRRKSDSPVVYPGDRELKNNDTVSSTGERRRRRNRSSGGRSGDYRAMLSAIPE